MHPGGVPVQPTGASEPVRAHAELPRYACIFGTTPYVRGGRDRNAPMKGAGHYLTLDDLMLDDPGRFNALLAHALRSFEKPEW